ncbi:MAG: efflux RND transporter periplasmic adaptor subunit [Phenylobacterium sp.]|uniref:HlyD family secretion protein n=1 Tax=Phenylobacterium sp. TaxID=1871053 RepID=UPI00271F7DFD|nr:efflux RND transporter periplasmic adaptor subunit [Phenylobacterium sp.]MDO8912580.1 efflux RND transporter periplasmic adaptor subunit [Phenylobacterium sp.]MDP3101637.1 efflux RND transporter periplasmic adaptor subunit [Phenylobacterium sp.]
MKFSPKSAAVLVALGLVAIASASGVAYWRMRPEPLPAQLIYGSGRIEADEVRIAPEVSGRVVENRAVEGQSVRAGETLARIDPADYTLLAERAKAQRVAALRTAAQIDAQIGLAAHHARTARTDLARYEALERQGWIPAQRLDVARNSYAAASDQVSVLRQQRAEADAQAMVATKSLALARSQIAKTEVVAPLSGAVLERLAEPGEVVAAGQPVAVLANLATVRLKVFIQERDLGRLRLGAPARIRVDAFPGRDLPARVARVDAQAQFTPRDVHIADERSRTVYGVTLEAANPEGLLKPGMPADSWILWDARRGWPAALRVPD